MPKYIKAAFQIFRNYDGKGGTYADTAVQAAPVAAGDLDKASIFAAVDSKHPGTLTVLVINKDQHTAFNGKIEITPEAKSGTVYQGARSSASTRAAPRCGHCRRADVANNQISYRLPPLSATLFVCRR